MFKQIWNSREIIWETSVLEFGQKYRGTILGFFWSVLEPLAQLLILFVVFSFLHSFEENFVVYLFSGLIMIHFFSRSTTQAMNSLSSKKSILLSINIPKIIFPISSILTNFWMFKIEIAIFFIFIILFGLTLDVTALLLFVTFGLLVILTIGTGIILTILRTYVKDIQTIWGIITMSLIFVTPVFWYVDDMPPFLAKLFLLNPLALLMEMTHDVILFNSIPTIYDFIYAIGTSFGSLIIAYVLYKKNEKKITELL